MNEHLEAVARHVNWYTEPQRVLAEPDWFLAQVMARGSFEDIVTILEHYSRDDLRQAYLAAPPGLFTRRAWAYWGLMLVDDAARPMPERFPGANRLDWRRAT
ncbi:MAG: hypothetical protein ACREUT_13960 [Steroidobacteraceae bacterium]